MAVFIDLDVRPLRGELMNLLRNDDRSVVRVGVPHESADETYKDIGDFLGHTLDWRRRRSEYRNPEQENNCETGMRSSEAELAELPHHSDDLGR